MSQLVGQWLGAVDPIERHTLAVSCPADWPRPLSDDAADAAQHRASQRRAALRPVDDGRIRHRHNRAEPENPSVALWRDLWARVRAAEAENRRLRAEVQRLRRRR